MVAFWKSCVLVSAEAIVTAPPDSVIVTFDPAVKARVSLLAKVLPPAVTVLTDPPLLRPETKLALVIFFIALAEVS